MTYANAVEFRAAIVSAFEARVAFEMNKNSPDSMFNKLREMSKSIDHDAIAEIMFAAGCDANRIMFQRSANACYNIYAYEKDVNIARALAKVEGLNHYTFHILRTMKALHDAELSMTHNDAFTACKASAKPDDKAKAKFISKYVRIDVAEGTANTQSSSSINALISYKVLIPCKDANNEKAYKLNIEGAETQALLALVA